MSTSKAAEELIPDPFITLLVVYASNPPILYPRLLSLAHTPLIRAAEVYFSLGLEVKSSFLISSVGKPSEITLMTPSLFFAAAAIMSRLTAAARILPALWSVWFPPISVLPGVLKSSASE
jgi:hypothetical protein